MGIESLFAAVVAWEGSVVPGDEVLAAGRYARKLQEIDEKKQFSLRTAKALLKPHRVMFKRIAQRFGGVGVAMFALGDSVQKDLAPCVEFGATTIWARYGRDTDPKNQELLDHLTPWARSEFEAHYRGTSIVPDFVVDRFADIRECLPIAYQRSLF